MKIVTESVRRYVSHCLYAAKIARWGTFVYQFQISNTHCCWKQDWGLLVIMDRQPERGALFLFLVFLLPLAGSSRKLSDTVRTSTPCALVNSWIRHRAHDNDESLRKVTGYSSVGTPRTSRRNALMWIAALVPNSVTHNTSATPSFLLPANALTPEEASNQYDTYAPTYDRLDGGAASSLLGIEEARAELFRRARGNVLEIGVGTGACSVVYVCWCRCTHQNTVATTTGGA